MNVLVTGTSRGIGKALIREFASKGHTVIALSRNVNATEKVPERVLPIQFDWEDYEHLLEELKVHLGNGKVDVLVNNAGLLLKDEMINAELEDLERMYRVNAVWPLMLTRALIQADRLAPGAHIVNISSMAGYQGASKYPGLGGYSMSKAALVALTECMTAEWSDRIRANCLCLGAVNTEMLKEAFPGYISEVSDKKMASFICDFAVSGSGILSGRVLPVANSDP